MVRNIGRRIFGRPVITVCIDTEYTEISCMPRPHPIVRIPAKLTDRRGRCKNQPYVVEIAINGKPKLISAIISIDNTYQRRILAGDLSAYHHHHRIHRAGTFHLVHRRFDSSQYALRHIFRAQQETDIKFRIRKLFLTATRHKTVLQIIVFH